MKRHGLELGALAVAFGTATGAFASAFAGLHLPITLLVAGAASLIAWTAQRRPLQSRRLPPIAAIVRILLILIGVVALLSRDIPVIGEEVASRVGLLAGGALGACAIVLLWAVSARSVAASVVPAIVGLLVAAGLEGKGRLIYVPLACVAGAALWTWALVTGGPRRRLLPLALFLLAGAGVGVGAVLFLPWAQPYVEAFAARGLAEGQTGLSDRAQLGDIQKLAPSRRVVARVWTTKPQLLRMQVFTDFDGKSWSVKAAPPREVVASEAQGDSLGPLLSAAPGGLFAIAPEAHGPVVETRVVPSLSFDDGWGLLVPARPVLLRAPGEKVRVDDDLGRIDTDGVVSTYAVANALAPTAATMSEPAADGPARRTTSDPRIRALAAELAASASSPRERLDRTIEHLTTHYRYTLEGLPSSLDDFLFGKKAGYCEFFATAAVMLLRYQDVPARFVKGVRVNPESEVGGHYLVREADAHAWIEAYLPGEGWVEADPTPARSGVSGSGRLDGLAARWESLQTAFIEAWIHLREGGPGWRAALESVVTHLRVALERQPARTGGAAVVVALALVAWAYRKRGRRSRRYTRRIAQDRALVPAELRSLVGRVERFWARVGRPRPPNRGLREHLDALPAGVLTTREREAVAPIVATYYRARFGGAALSEADLAELRKRASVLER